MKNQIQLIGNIGIDPKITQLKNGSKRVQFTLATHEKYKDKQGKSHDKTFWHHVYAWGPTANYIEKSGRKGTPVAITGKLVTKKYQSKQGQAKTYTSIEAKNVIALNYSSH